MSLDSLFPHAGNHSIQNAVMAIEWGGELSIEQLEKLRASAKAILADCPREEQQQSIRVNIAPVQNPMTAPAPEVTGYTFSRFSPNGDIEKQIQINRVNCLIIVSDYRRWHDLITEVSKLLSVIFCTADASVSVSAVGLQYSDRFVWKGQPEELKLQEVFQANSPFIAPHSLECSAAWHSHHGYFIVRESPVLHRRLDNMNVNVNDESEGRVIQILTSHRALLEEHIVANQALDAVLSLQDDIHKVNKSIFRQLLSDELLKKINLSEGNKES